MFVYNIFPENEIKNKIDFIELSIFDGVFIDINYIYILKGKIDIEKIKKSLSSILDYYPIIGGKLRKEDNYYYIDIKNPFVNIYYNYTDIGNINYKNNLFSVFINCDDNKTILKIIMNHVIGDAKTMENVMISWENEYNNIKNDKNINLKRYKTFSYYKRINNIIENKDVNIYKLYNQEKFNLSDMENLENYKFCIPTVLLKKLKEKTISFSSLDSLSAYLFNVCKSLENTQTLKKVCTAVNFRKRINIDENLTGNYIITVSTEIQDNKSLNIRSIIETSKDIRKSINGVNVGLINKHGLNIEFYRRKFLFEKYMFNLSNDCFITNSWINYNINKCNFKLELEDFTPPYIPIPYFTLYTKINDKIYINIMLPKNVISDFKNIINNDFFNNFHNYQ